MKIKSNLIYIVAVIIIISVFFISDNKLKFLFDNILSIFMPFLIGISISFILNSPVKWFEKQLFNIKSFKFRRSISILITIICFLTVIYFFLIMIIPQIILNINKLINNFDNIILKFQESTIFIEKFISKELILNMLNQSYNIPEILRGTLPHIYEFITSLTKLIWNFIIGLIISVYILYNKEYFSAQIKKFMYTVVSSKNVRLFINIARLSSNIFSGFIIARIIDSIIIGLSCLIGTFFIGIEDFVIVTIIIMMTNLIPYFGAVLGAIPCIIIIFVQDPIKSLIFTIFIFIVQQLDGNFIEPKIVGSKTGLSGFWVIFSITIGGGLFGILGVFLSVPVFAVIYNVISYWIKNKLIEKNMPFDTKYYLGNINFIKKQNW